MKRIIQLTLFLVLASTCLILYKTYFQQTKNVVIENNLTSINSNTENKNNLIKNLKYEVTIDKNNR